MTTIATTAAEAVLHQLLLDVCTHLDNPAYKGIIADWYLDQGVELEALAWQEIAAKNYRPIYLEYPYRSYRWLCWWWTEHKWTYTGEAISYNPLETTYSRQGVGCCVLPSWWLDHILDDEGDNLAGNKVFVTPQNAYTAAVRTFVEHHTKYSATA